MKNYLIKGIRILMNREFNRIYEELRRLWQLTLKVFFIYIIYLKILARLAQDKKIVFVYDNKVSPPTYGDYFAFLMLVRLLNFLSKKIIFILVQDKLRYDWNILSNEKIEYFRNQQILLAESVLKVFDIQNYYVMTINQTVFIEIS